MKKLIFILTMFVLTSCTTSYYKTMNLETGELITVKISYPVNVGDTIILSKSNMPKIRGYHFFGKYIGNMPKQKETFSKFPNGNSVKYLTTYHKVKIIE